MMGEPQLIPAQAEIDDLGPHVRRGRRYYRWKGRMGAREDVRSIIQRMVDRHKPGWNPDYDDAYLLELRRLLEGGTFRS
jgi:hypothetical protein